MTDFQGVALGYLWTAQAERIAELEATVKAMQVERNEAYDAGRDGLPNPFSDGTEPLP